MKSTSAVSIAVNLADDGVLNSNLFQRRKSMRLLNSVKLSVLLFVLAASTSALAADATITFQDNADNETGFRIERNLNGGAYTPLPVALPSNGVGLTVSVLDTTLVQSTSADNKYCYQAVAFNTAGDSPFATTATPGVTDCKVIPRLIVIPTGPAGLLVK
jgi:hypothetical protein